MRKVSEITAKVAHISGTLKKVAKSLLESPRDSLETFFSLGDFVASFGYFSQ